eukprot:6628190-Pyramimonas_sp.AAC.1
MLVSTGRLLGKGTGAALNPKGSRLRPCRSRRTVTTSCLATGVRPGGGETSQNAIPGPPRPRIR